VTEPAITTHARARPDRLALIDADRTRTFAELDARANQVARVLARRGVVLGDRIGLSLRNSIEFFEVSSAAARLGATVVPVPWRNKRDEVEYMVSDSKAKVLFAEEDNRSVVEGIPGAIFRGVEYEGLVGAEESSPPEAGDVTGTSGFRYYTSGTTGRPKAIVRMASPDAPPQTRGDMVASMGGRLAGLIEPDNVHLLAGAAYHTAPGIFSNLALNFGQTLVIMSHFDAEECLRLIERHRVTWSQMVPIHFVRILALEPKVRDRYVLSSVRRILHAAAPCPVDVKWKIMDVFPPGTIYEYYAATEGLATECPPEIWTRKPGTVGIPSPGIEIHILDEEGREVAPNEVGQIYVTPPGGARFEYEGAPKKTAETWRDNMFSVGDMGYLDEDGYLFLTDRKTHMIISGGANIYPAEVENVLFAHPAVSDVAVLGVPDAEWGEQVKAIVEAKAAVTESELIEFARERLSHYKCPKTVDFVEAMPRDPNGKIKKRELRDPYWTGAAHQI
jgi:long-chain acyl-CoA synthetase